MVKLINNFGGTPNILHFHGKNKGELPSTFNRVEKEAVLTKPDDRIAIVSTWTNKEDCCLYQQCKKFGIGVINCVPDDYDTTQPWYMPNKIKFFINTLEKIDKDIVLFLDGYDVLITSFDGILDKFFKSGYEILFGPSCNNYPDVSLDVLYGRSELGLYRYFNAGCCIGYRESLLKFYKEALEYVDVFNPKNSEQLVMRYAFAKYSNDKKQKFINIDNKCEIFQSMGYIESDAPTNNEVINIWNNKMPSRIYVVTGSDGFIGKHLVAKLKTRENVKVFCIDRVSGSEIDTLDWIMKNYDVNCVFHLAAQTSVFNDNKEQIVKDNILSFIHVCDLCSKYGTKLVYASSSTANNGNTTSLYGLSKRFDEEYAKMYCPEAIGVRLHNVYSEKYPREGTLMWHLLNDEETILYNNGENIRCFTYIDDAVDGLLKSEFITGHSLVNCVNYEPITTKEFAEMARRCNSKIKYSLTMKMRDKDNEEQKVDTSIPLIELDYRKVSDIFEKLPDCNKCGDYEYCAFQYDKCTGFIPGPTSYE